MNDVVVGTLREGTVNVAEGHQPVLCHSSRESHCVSLCNTHVKGTVWHCFHEFVHGASRRHCGRHAHYLGVQPCQFHESFAENVLIFRRQIFFIACNSLSGIGVKLAWSVPYSSCILSRLIAFSLYGMDMKKFRTAHILQLVEHSHQFFHVMSIDGTEVTDVQSLEDILLFADD